MKLYAVLNNGKVTPNFWCNLAFIPYTEGMSRDDLLSCWLAQDESSSDREIITDPFYRKINREDHSKRLVSAWIVTEETKLAVTMISTSSCAGNDSGMDAITATLLSTCRDNAVKTLSLSYQPEKLILPDVLPLFSTYKEKHSAWGILHAILDDGNVETAHLDVVEMAGVKGCCWIISSEERWLLRLLRRMSPTQRRKLPGMVEKS